MIGDGESGHRGLGLKRALTLHSVLWGSAEVARLLLDEESDGEIRLADVNAERVMSALTG